MFLLEPKHAPGMCFLHYLLAYGIPEKEDWGLKRRAEDPGTKEDIVTEDLNKDPVTENPLHPNI